MLMRAAKDAGIDIGDVADLHAERTGKRSASLDKEARKSKVQKKYDPNGTPSDPIGIPLLLNPVL